MRSLPLAILLAIPMALLAQQVRRPDAVSSYRLTPRGAPGWSLMVRTERGTRGAFPGDWRAARLVTEGLRVEWIPAERWTEAAHQEGAPVLRWVLKGPDGAIEPGGVTLPDGTALEALLRRRTGPLPWDGLEEALKTEPDHGEARRIHAVWLMTWTNFATLRQNPELRPAFFLPSSDVAREASSALDRLLKVPDWPSHLDLAATEGEAPLGALLPLASTLQQRQRMADQLLEALSEDPESDAVQRNLAAVLRILDRDGFEARVERMEQLEPLPGQAWPPMDLAETAFQVWAAKQAWAQLRTKAGEWAKDADRLHLDEQVWKAHVARNGLLCAWGHVASSWLQGWEVLPGALDDLRGRCGPDYPSHARTLLKHANLPVGNFELVKQLRELAARPALPGPPMPPPWPVLVLEAREPELVNRLRLALDSPHLMHWLPSERRVEGRPGEAGTLRLSLGKALIAEPPDWPGEAWLASSFLSARPGRLIQAMDGVGQRPEFPGPRRRRARFLLQRMPLRAVEDLLAEDLRRLGEAADLKTWPLDENLWYAEAQRALPEIEAHLKRWPLDAARWRGYGFWSAFLPAHAGPSELAANLPSWKPRLPLSLCLTREVHWAVAGALEDRRAWASLRRWCDLALDSLNAIEDRTLRERLGTELAGVLAGVHDLALRNLGLEGERRSALAGWRHFQSTIAR